MKNHRRKKHQEYDPSQDGFLLSYCPDGNTCTLYINGDPVEMVNERHLDRAVAHRDEAVKVLHGILAYFHSGNEVPVTRVVFSSDADVIVSAMELLERHEVPK